MPSIFKALRRAGRSESSEAGQGERIKRNTGTDQSEAANSTEEFDVDKHLNTIEDLGQTMAALDRATTLDSTPSPAQVAPKGSTPRKGEPWGKNGCYKYQRLDQGNIRLLKIINSVKEPPDGEGGAIRIVMFELVHVDLDQPPPYITLSYVWGKDQRRKDDVSLVGDQILPITKSLGMAMAQVLRVNHDGYVWIDQFCMYLDRYGIKCCRNLRSEPLFCEGIGCAHLACPVHVHEAPRSWFGILYNQEPVCDPRLLPGEARGNTL